MHNRVCACPEDQDVKILGLSRRLPIDLGAGTSNPIVLMHIDHKDHRAL